MAKDIIWRRDKQGCLVWRARSGRYYKVALLAGGKASLSALVNGEPTLLAICTSLRKAKKDAEAREQRLSVGSREASALLARGSRSQAEEAALAELAELQSLGNQAWVEADPDGALESMLKAMDEARD